MARRNTICIYDKNHNLQIFNKNGFIENRCLNINTTDLTEYVQIKVRDVSDFVFNYTAHIDLRQFDVMRTEQCLDIDFNEFKTNLLDMLQQVQKHEMFLKCETNGNIAKLIFYELQNMNKNLNNQIQITKQSLQEKDLEIDKFVKINKQLEKKYMEELQKLSYIFSKKLQECSAKLLNRILSLTQKLLKLIQDVEIVKAESLLKSDSSARLLQSMENLRLESIETSRIVNELKRENCTLKSAQVNNQKEIEELNDALHNQESKYFELRQERDELEKDVKQATMIIAQKTSANEELAKDVVQANQMLVNFNHLFSSKNEEIEELKNSIENQQKIMQEQSNRYHQLCKEFEEYQAKFNSEQQNRLSQELYEAHKRLEQVEKHDKETAKLNELLTRKLASGDFTRRSMH